MIDLNKVKRAIEIQKEIIITKLVEKSEDGEVLDKDEIKMLENYYEDNMEE